MAEQFGEKQHDATPHRREKAREEGQVARSQDLVSAVMLVCGLLAMWMVGAALLLNFQELLASYLGAEPALQADRGALLARWWSTLNKVGSGLLPILGTIFLAGVLVNLAQGGPMFLPQKALPQLNRLDILANFRRLVSLQGWIKLAFGIAKLIVIGAVAWFSVSSHLAEIGAASSLTFSQIVSFGFGLLFWTLLKVAGALLLLAVLEYGFQWWKHEQDLRMTTQEVKEEFRNLQGDPQIMARRRMVQRQMLMQSLANTVPKATFVVTNPTELAIAIKYDLENISVPVVIAKGSGLVAQRIRRLALENGIPVVERKPLAQALFHQVELNQPVPRDMWNAISEVIRYVYELKGMQIPAGAR